MNLKQFVNQIRKNQQWQIFPDFLMLIGVVGSLLYFVSVILFGYAIDGLTEQQIITMANITNDELNSKLGSLVVPDKLKEASP